MTTKTLSTYTASGYYLAAGFSELDITTTGGARSVYSSHYATLSNAGAIDPTFGAAIAVVLPAGGLVINRQTGFIGGQYYGVASNASLKVENYGTIRVESGRAISAIAGGSVINGAYQDLGATIAGGAIALQGAAGAVTNFGTITAFLYMNAGGTITNGGVEDTTALMNAGGGIYLTAVAGTVNNFGTILAYGSPGHNGVNLGAGGRIANGAVNDTTARIEGGTGVILNAVGTVSNFGTIEGSGAAHGDFGVALYNGGGLVTNGGGLATGALVEGYTGVQIGGAAGTVVNSGTIAGLGYGTGQYGVYLKAGGSVTNGGGANHAALIEGADGVATAGTGAATVSNFGTILATGATGVGVKMSQGGLVNGSLNNGAALIEGYTGAVLAGSAGSTNFGTISGLGDHGGWGVVLGGSESLVNAQGRRLKATIEGYGGVYAMGTANTLVNFATISGAGGTAVKFGSATDVLVVEAGCEFDGAVLGGGGTLDLVSGTGTLGGLAGGNVTVSGSMAATAFTAFNTIEVGAGATFTDAGAASLSAGQTLIDAGTLGVGAIANGGVMSVTGGTLTVTGAVTGSGHVTMAGGVADFTSSFNQAVTFSPGTAILELAQSQTYTATLSGFSKSGATSLDLADIAFGGSTKASYSGTATSGTLTVTDGTHTAHINLKGNYLSSVFVAASDGHGGTVVHDPKAPAAIAPPHGFISAMAGMGGGGAGLTIAVRDWRPAITTSLIGPRPEVA